MNHQMDRIELNLERLLPEITAIRIDLNYHIAMTKKHEKTLEIHKTALTKLTGFFSYGGWLVATAATVLTILTILGKIK